MALVQKAFSDIITFSRSSNATRIGPTGLVEYAPHNLLLQSQTFDNASWTKDTGSVATANAATAPDGTVTAEFMYATIVSTFNQRGIYQGTSLAVNTTYAFSVYAKKGTSNFLAMRHTALSGAPFAWFNLNTGAVGTVQSGLTASIQSVGNGWYRCAIAGTTSGSISVNRVDLNVSDADNSSAVAVDGGIYIWGAQLAVGPYALDYTPTTSAAVYGPRFDFDPVTLAARGLLVEESRTNLLTYSEQFDNAAWAAVGSGLVVTANTETAPSGAVTADTLTLSLSYRLQEILGLSSGSTYTFSVWAKTASGTITLGLAEANGSGNTTKTVTTSWQRFTFTFTAANSTVYVGVDQRVVGASTSGSVYIWGAQLEAGSFATSYIPTIASTVTRSADVASVNTLSPWWNATESTIYSEFDTFSTNDAFPYALGTKNNNEIGVYRIGSNGNVATLMFTSTVLQNNSTIATGTALNATINAAYAIKANDLAGSANGGAAVTDTTATLPSVSTLYLGSRDDGTGPLNGHLRRLAVYPRRLTNAEIQALTA